MKIYVPEKNIYVQKKQKNMRIILVFILFTFASCGSNRPVATTHTERIEEKVMPVAVGADTIEITEYRLQSTDNRVQITHFARDFYSARHNEQALSALANRKNIQSTDTPCSLLPTPYSIKSTRGVNISRYKTDTTSTLRITLRPDTVFVPYINHIRSDTIVVPDRICNKKLNRSNMTNLFLILILIVIFIILFKQKYKFYR